MDLGFDDIFENDLDIIDIIDYGFPRLQYTRSEPFNELDDFSFYRRFRLTKEVVLDLLILLEEDLEYPNDLNNSVSPVNQLLTTLRYYASAGHLITIADMSGMHTSTVSRIIKRVSEAIARLRPRYINMPTTPEEIERTHTEFYEISAFPRVIGAIDGTHIKIQSPGGDDGEVFRNRKSYFSINVQGVCNANLEIMDLVASWPGSAHDATIFNNSRLKGRFENNEFPNSVLLGDSGYPVRNYFLTPVGNPVTEAQQRYNEAHIRTRNTVERFFGNWKRRFPVLAYGMRLKLDTILTLIVATAVLQNIARQMNLNDPPPPENIDPEELDALIENGQVQPLPHVDNNVFVNNVRNNFINNYFNNL